MSSHHVVLKSIPEPPVEEEVDGITHCVGQLEQLRWIVMVADWASTEMRIGVYLMGTMHSGITSEQAVILDIVFDRLVDLWRHGKLECQRGIFGGADGVQIEMQFDDIHDLASYRKEGA